MGRTQPTQNIFPYKLHRLLDALHSNDPTSSSASIAWLSHGRAFKIHDQADFICNVVPKYFKQTKLRSFIRQLHLWGFMRIIDGPDKGAWYHPNFLRGEPSQLPNVQRTSVKKKKSVDAFYMSATPNYYDMLGIGANSIHEATTVDSAAADTIRNTPTMQSKSSCDKEVPAVFSNEGGLKEERIIDTSNLTGAVQYQLPASYTSSLTAEPYAMTRNSNQLVALAVPYAAAAQRRSSWAGTNSEVMSYAPTSSQLQQHLDECMMNQDLQMNQCIVDPQPLSSQSNIYSLQGEAIATTTLDRQPTDELVRRAIQFTSMGKNGRRASCPELFGTASPTLEQQTIGDLATAAKPQLDVLSNHGSDNQDFGGQHHQQENVRSPSSSKDIHSLAEPSLERDVSSGCTISYLLKTLSDGSGSVIEDPPSIQFDTNASNVTIASGGQAVDNHHSFNSNQLSFVSGSYCQTVDDEFVQFINEALPNLNHSLT